MPRLFGYAYDDTIPARGVFVACELIPDGAHRTAGGVVASQARTYTDADGRWELDLVANADLAPPDSYYVVRVWRHSEYVVRVPASADPVNVEDVALPYQPGNPPTPWELTQYERTADLGTTGHAAGPLDGSGKLPPEQIPPTGGVAGVASVNGRSGVVVLAAGDVGLGNVANLAPADLPVSTATAAAVTAAVDAHEDAADPHPQYQTAAEVSAAVAAAVAGVDFPVDSVAGKTGAVTLTPADVGLGSVPNVAPTAVLAAVGGVLATDAAVAETFVVTLTGPTTLAAPTNPAAGMRRTWQLAQDGVGGRTLTLAAGAGGFVLGSLVPNTTPDGTPNKVAYLTAYYHATSQRWHVVAFEPGA